MSDTPGKFLVSPAALSAVLLIVVNDLWLKRYHAGFVSGKLSDIGLAVFFPLVLASALEWVAWGLSRIATWCGRSGTREGRARLHLAACAIAGTYFVAIKCVPTATHAHVALLSALFPAHRFTAVTDPTDVVALAFLPLAWWTLARARRSSGRRFYRAK